MFLSRPPLKQCWKCLLPREPSKKKSLTQAQPFFPNIVLGGGGDKERISKRTSKKGKFLFWAGVSVRDYPIKNRRGKPIGSSARHDSTRHDSTRLERLDPTRLDATRLDLARLRQARGGSLLALVASRRPQGGWERPARPHRACPGALGRWAPKCSSTWCGSSEAC